MDPVLTSQARSTTRAASLHTYLVLRWLVDRDLSDVAFQAYAYFRWLDDELDRPGAPRAARLGFLRSQQQLLEQARGGTRCHPQRAEEAWLVELVRGDRPDHPGLRSYVDRMMAVMRFDAERRGRTIRSEELSWYSRSLSQAVMDGLSYFVGHRFHYPQTGARWLAAFGAHVVHMLRDAAEDVSLGYFNVPREYLTAHRLDPYDVSGAPYRAWVRHRLALARRCFEVGRQYIAGLTHRRVRWAGYAYCARFEKTLVRIENDLRLPAPSLAEITPAAMRSSEAMTSPRWPR
ncbi:MAG TPA: squalene/phytoene synthase family protein [Anaerolineales bacterium]|nr:squalene/phytoene synthase family protein [Anaerolineales bacterium]